MPRHERVRCGSTSCLGPLRLYARGGHLQAGGLSPLSFAYFSLRPAKKVGAAPHRGDANRPIRNQGKANAVSTNQQTGAAGKKATTTTNEHQTGAHPCLTAVQPPHKTLTHRPCTAMAHTLLQKPPPYCRTRRQPPDNHPATTASTHHRSQNMTQPSLRPARRAWLAALLLVASPRPDQPPPPTPTRSTTSPKPAC